MYNIITTDDMSQEDVTELGALEYRVRSNQSLGEQVAQIPKFFTPEFMEEYINYYFDEIEKLDKDNKNQIPTYPGKVIGSLSRKEMYEDLDKDIDYKKGTKQ